MATTSDVKNAAQELLPAVTSSGAKMRGADLFVDTLIRLGVSDAFNVIGLGMYPLGDAFFKRRAEIRYISDVNESNLTLAAQGYARARRAPACAIVYYSSGTSFAMVGLTVAWAERVPLVLVSTTNSRLTSGRDQYAAVPRSILEMGSQFVKWSYEVPTADRIPEAVARAFAIAAQPPMGPVHLAIPADLWPEVVVSPPPCDDFERTHSFARTCADEAGLSAAAEMLVNAQRPAVIFGSEIGQYGAVPEAVRLAEALGAPVFLEDQSAFLPFPTSHSQYIGKLKRSRVILETADVALLVGVELTQLGYPEPPLLPSSLKTIALSADPVLPVRQRWPDIALAGHPQPSLNRLCELIGGSITPKVVARNRAAASALRAERVQKADALRHVPWENPSVLPSALIDVVHKYCDQKWVIVDALSSAGAHFDELFEFDDPRLCYGLSGKGSAQGWGAPTAIGIQIGTPNKRVMALVGDGNLMFTSSSLYQAARMKLPIVFVVVNNGGWAHLRRGQLKAYDDGSLVEMGWLFDKPPIDFVSLARSFGLTAARATTAAELTKCLQEAGSSNEPWLIDTITEGEGPKE